MNHLRHLEQQDLVDVEVKQDKITTTAVMESSSVEWDQRLMYGDKDTHRLINQVGSFCSNYVIS
jgi:hypothetical protein